MYALILGANSDMAEAIAARFAREEGANLYLASRNTEQLERKAADSNIRYGVEAKALHFDATDYSSHRSFYDGLDPKPDIIVAAFGLLGNQGEAQRDFEHARRVVETNYLGAVSILEIAAEDFEKRGHGCIIGLSSVAGQRGRQSNYIYGSAKGAFSVYLSGLRHRLFKRNVRVMTVLPGFARTKMTESMQLPQRLTAEPEDVAADVHRGYKKGKDVIYTRWLWKWIMMVIVHLPEGLFKRSNL